MKVVTILFSSCIALTNFTYPLRAQAEQQDSLFRRAYLFLDDAEYTNAIIVFRECLDLAAAGKDSLHMGNALLGIGVANDNSGRFDTALHYYFRALDIYERNGNQARAGSALKNIGSTYRVLKVYDKALSYLQQALVIQKDSTRIGKIINDIGLVYMDQDSLTKARMFFEQVISGYSRHLSYELKAYVFNNLALIYSKTQRYGEALRYYQSALSIMQNNHHKYGIALILGNIGDLYYNKGEYSRALQYHLRSLDTIRHIKSNELLLNAYALLGKTYTGMGNYKMANEYLVLQMERKDTIYQEESRKSYAEMEAKYQNEKKQTEILLLQQKNRVVNIEIAAQRRVKYSLLIVCGLIFIITLSLYKSYTARKKANLALNRLNRQLAESNSSKAKLISIISHDLRSPVSSLFHFLQLRKIQAEKFEKKDQEAFDRKISQSAENLLEAMEDLLVWSKTQMNHFEPAMEAINASDLLEEIICLYEQFAVSKNITLRKEFVMGLQFNTDPNFVKIILRNLISNAIKFTPANGTIILSACRQDGAILLTVKDNGPGIDQTDLKTLFEWNSIRSDSSGLGLKLAKEFTEKLGGNLSVFSDPGRGTVFIVSLPFQTQLR